MLAKADWMNGFLNGNSQENDLLIIRGWVLVLEVEDSWWINNEEIDEYEVKLKSFELYYFL